MMKKGPEAGMKMVQKIKTSGEDKYYFDEKEFNTLGYKFLFTKKVDEAITVFKLNVKMYEDSWNTYDSLAEGYLVAGKYDKAKKYYKKSLVMNPENENGKKMLTKIAKLEEDGESVAKKK
jgi:pentatricopeptide repeat protein